MVARGFAHELRAGHGGAVDRHFVRARVEQPLDIADLAHAAANRQRNEDLRGYPFDDRQDDVALIAGGGDVQESQLVGALFVVAAGDFDRVARVDQVDEIHALDHAPGGDIQAGDDAAGQTIDDGRVGDRIHLESSLARFMAASKLSVPS